MIALSNGEQVTLVNQLDENKWSSIEFVTFADGTTLNQDELRDRMVADMKAGGTVIGTENGENYVHTLGDGSYSITDYNAFSTRTDTLTFTDVNADDVVLSRIHNDVIISLPNGETITLIRQLDENKWHSIETFT
ncbi:calcium-binding protein, partial [Ruegeria atlantica]|uniref:calcium-binding protein n=1 Tax=Ruegeria atlantica TaxID=81569 RepID=UPI0024957EE8